MEIDFKKITRYELQDILKGEGIFYFESDQKPRLILRLKRAITKGNEIDVNKYLKTEEEKKAERAEELKERKKKYPIIGDIVVKKGRCYGIKKKYKVLCRYGNVLRLIPLMYDETVEKLDKYGQSRKIQRITHNEINDDEEEFKADVRSYEKVEGSPPYVEVEYDLPD